MRSRRLAAALVTWCNGLVAPGRVLLSLLFVVLTALGVVGACSADPSFVDDTGQGGAGAAGGGGPGGTGDECTVAADCPGDDTDCAARACDNGFCGIAYRPAGFEVGLQTAGDCRKNACDGEGNASEVDDDTDAPNDGNDCTKDACSGGAPDYTNQREGSPCGVGLTCNAVGLCIGCTEAAQCGADTACLLQACMDETCYQVPVPDGGGDVPGQTPEDCKVLVCNGMGAVKTINDPLDVKPDNNLCTIDGCNQGVPSYISVAPQDDANPCTADVCNPTTGATDHNPTNQGQSCGNCSVCNSNGGCVGTCGPCEACNGGQCQSQCSSCEVCNGGQCVSTCGNCQSCVNGSCQGGCGPCETCNGGQCQANCGPCQQCSGGSCVGGCGPCETCQGGSCVSNCGPCQTCNGGSCVDTCNACQTCSGGTCVDNCPACQTCSGGTCVSNCGDCEACIGGVCQWACTGCQDCFGGSCQFDPCLCGGCCAQDQSGNAIPIPCP